MSSLITFVRRRSCIADGVIPSNEWRGYVLRKIMRRAMRHGKHLGLAEPFLHRLVEVLVREMGEAYPELARNRETIEKTILAEEHRFDTVLTDGLPRLESEIARALEGPARVLPGDVAFRLYDTFGIPYDFIEDTAATHDIRVDRAGYDLAMQTQRETARGKSAFGGSRAAAEFDVSDATALKAATDQFEGYTATRVPDVPVVALFDGGRRPVDAIRAGEAGFAALARTPFYLEAGGQVSDTGRLVGAANGSVAVVEGVSRIGPGLPRAHNVRVESGVLRAGDTVTAEVDATLRDATRRNHTATHLLHAALRQVLGGHVKQAGSLVAPDRLRFDFVHFQPVTARRDRADRADRQRPDRGEHAGPDRGASHRGGDQGRRDGALRREVRRHRARRVHPRFQHGAVRRHARPRDRRHRLLCHRRGKRRRGRDAPDRGGHRPGRAAVESAAARRR